MAVSESGKLGAGAGAVHQFGEVARLSFPGNSGSTVSDGDLVYLSAGKIAIMSGASSQGASFLGVANGATPTFDMYGDTKTTDVVVLVGGVAKVGASSATYTPGQAVYIVSTGANVVTSASNGTSIGTIVLPPHFPEGTSGYYANAVTTVFIQLAHPALTV